MRVESFIPSTTQLIHNERRASANWSNGQIITATLGSIEDGRATLRTADDIVFTADAASIRGNIGDELTFSVARTSDGFSLTQIIKGVQTTAARADISHKEAFKEVFNTLEVIKETEELREEHRQEQSAKVAKAIARIRRAQNFIQGASPQSVMSALIESGADINKVSFSELNQIMTHARNEQQPEISDEELAKLEEQVKAGEHAREILKSLHRYDAAKSERNISQMSSAWEKLPKEVPPPAVHSLIESESTLTLDDVYKSSYLGREKAVLPPKAPWESLQQAIGRLFEREGIAPTPQNLDVARFLLDRGLPLTRDSIDKVLFLRDVPQNIRPDAFFDRAAHAISHGRPVGSLSLPEIARLTEIQLMFVTRAANVHQKLGLDTSHLRETVRSLNLMEADATRFLSMAGATPTAENTRQMTTLFNRINNMAPLTVNVHGGVLRGEIPFTIEAVHESVLFARARSQYEQYATVPNPRYGDSFQKVRGMFKPLLESLQIRPTNENLKASFILSKNSMDVNENNLEAVKEVEAKINAVAQKLHPMIAANMVRDGFNPLVMHVDEILAYIGRYSRQKGVDATRKVAEEIMDMDKMGKIDPQTRKGMIAMYRMLNIIKKDGARALGFAAEIGPSITLGELMDLSRNFTQVRSGTAIDVPVDESFGRLQTVVHPEGSVRAAFEAPSHMGVVVDGFMDGFAPHNMQAISSGELNSLALEDAAQMQPQVSEPPPEEFVLQQIKTFAAANPEIVHFLQTRGITTTAGHIRALERLTNSHRALADELEELAESSEVGDELLGQLPDTDISELRRGSGIGQIFAKILDTLSDFAFGGASAAAQDILGVTHGLNQDGERGFQMPIKIGGSISNLQMYVLNDRALYAPGSRILLSLDTPNLGMVSAYFTYAQNALDIVFNVTNTSTAMAINENFPALHEFLGKIGVSAHARVLVDSSHALETSLPPDALFEWAASSHDVRTQATAAHDYRV